MKNIGIIIFLILLSAVIVAVIVMDYSSGRPNKSKPNPFELNIDEYKNVPDEMIHYREIRNFNLSAKNLTALAVEGEKIYLAGDSGLKVIDNKGTLLLDVVLPFKPKAITTLAGVAYMASENQIFVVDERGNLAGEWEPLDEQTFITALAVSGDQVFIADAGNRRVLRYTTSGQLLNEFEGKTGNPDLNGFIVPSPYFDLGINNENELWVVNPGLHAIQNYTYEGNLRGYWEKSGIKTEGFSGCCNPAHIAFLSDGRFITSEKGMVRIKVYKPSGELDGVVAAPSKFKDMGQAPDIAADKEGNIYALDFDSNMIRMFEPVRHKEE